MTMSPSTSCFSFEASFTTAPLSTVERQLAYPWAVLDQPDPAAAPKALVAGRVLDDSVKGDVVAHDDLSHFRFSFRLGVSCCLKKHRARGELSDEFAARVVLLRHSMTAMERGRARIGR